MNFETKYNVGYKHGNFMRAWFLAPETSQYKFYMSCDDKCLLKLGKTPGDSTTGLEEIINIDSWTYYRDYWSDLSKRTSEWFTLTKG
jgi:hypothetical protein